LYFHVAIHDHAFQVFSNSSLSLSDGKWHRVRVSRIERNLLFVVDGKTNNYKIKVRFKQM